MDATICRTRVSVVWSDWPLKLKQVNVDSGMQLHYQRPDQCCPLLMWKHNCRLSLSLWSPGEATSIYSTLERQLVTQTTRSPDDFICSCKKVSNKSTEHSRSAHQTAVSSSLPVTVQPKLSTCLFPQHIWHFQETGTDNISALCWCRHHIMTGVRRINRPTVWDNMTKCFYSLVEQQHICVKTPIKYTLFLCLYSLLVCLFVQLGMWCRKFFILSWSTSRLGLISQCVCIQARTWLQKNENEDSFMTVGILPNWNSAPCC